MCSCDAKLGGVLTSWDGTALALWIDIDGLGAGEQSCGKGFGGSGWQCVQPKQALSTTTFAVPSTASPTRIS